MSVQNSDPTCGTASLNVVLHGIYGAIGGAVSGLIVGAVIGSPLLLTAGVWAASMATGKALDSAVNSLAVKFKWNASTICFTKAVTNALVGTALIASAVSLGIIGSFGVSLMGAIIGAGVLSLLISSIVYKLAEINPQLKTV